MTASSYYLNLTKGELSTKKPINESPSQAAMRLVGAIPSVFARQKAIAPPVGNDFLMRPHTSPFHSIISNEVMGLACRNCQSTDIKTPIRHQMSQTNPVC
jgi:hypothetical protein